MGGIYRKNTSLWLPIPLDLEASPRGRENKWNENQETCVLDFLLLIQLYDFDQIAPLSGPQFTIEKQKDIK